MVKVFWSFKVITIVQELPFLRTQFVSRICYVILQLRRCKPRERKECTQVTKVRNGVLAAPEPCPVPIPGCLPS